MDFKVLFDKDAAAPNFKVGWGFSLFSEGILFDTGEDSFSLIHNLKEAKVKLDSIQAVVISHQHWDHTGGLWGLLEARKGLKVYGCPAFSGDFKKKVTELGGQYIEAEGLTCIKRHIYTTGEIAGSYKTVPRAEQALVVKTGEILVVIVGCAHAGAVQIIEKVKGFFPKQDIDLLMGGFHLIEKEKREIKLIAQSLKSLGIKHIGSGHCTGYEAEQIFKEVFGEKSIALKAGQTIKMLNSKKLVL